MNPQDPLDALNTLREPLPVGWWPPAPGWWVLLVALLLTLGVLTFLWHRHHRKNRYRRRALKRLDALHDQYLAERNETHFLTQLNALLKRVALTAYPGAGIAAQHGQAWRTFLNEGLPASDQLGEEFDEAIYRKDTQGMDINRVYRAAAHWIRHHRVTR